MNSDIFSDDLNKFLEAVWIHNDIDSQSYDKIEDELFNECVNFVKTNRGFPSNFDVFKMYKGWAFESALYNLLFFDKQLEILIISIVIKKEDSRTWKLLGMGCFQLGLYEIAVYCLVESISYSVGSNFDAVYEVISSCYSYLGNEEESLKWIVNSKRAKDNDYYSKYGQMKKYAEIAFKKEVFTSEQFKQNELIIKMRILLQDYFKEK